VIWFGYMGDRESIASAGGQKGVQESQVFSGTDVGTDFPGWTIQSVSLTFNQIYLDSNNANKLVLDYTVEIYAAPPTEVWVATTGNDSNPGTESEPLATIQKGIDMVAEGGTVNVAAGTYNEDVDIDRAVTVTGAGQANTEIQGSVTITAPNVPDRVVLQDLTIISPWETSPYVVDTYYAIYINAESGDTAPVTIQNVTGRTTPTTQRVYGTGVLIGANGNTVDDVLIDNCTFDNNSTHGMFIENPNVNGGSVTNITLSNSTFDNNDAKNDPINPEQGWGLYIKNWPYQNGPFVDHFTVTNC
ncbi:unnamed protein product, partial [marine sediment metagenome]